MKRKIQKILIEDWFSTLIGEMEAEHHYATAKNYKGTLSSFENFLQGKQFYVSSLTPQVLRNYNRFLTRRSVCRNTISFYNRILRSAYNKAVKAGYARVKQGLFDDVFTGTEKTRKRALNVRVIKRIVNLDLHKDQEMEFVRDLFVFSFYARGMCFVDLAFLRMDALRGNVITYVRSKTSRKMSVLVEPCMERIIRKWHPFAAEDYVFPVIVSRNPQGAYKDYQYKLSRHNLILKEIGFRAGLSIPLNSYAARHSWASVARDSGTALSVISEGMGHTSERTTRIYLDELNHSAVDRANERVIGSVLN